MVGGPYLADNLALLREDGRLVIIAALGGAKGEVNLGTLFVKRLTVTGSTLRNRSPAEKGRIARGLRERVWPLLESRAVAPVVQATFPLEEAARAHEILEANRGPDDLILLGIPTRGVALADRLARIVSRIAGVDVVEELHALHHAATVDVQAGNDAASQHRETRMTKSEIRIKSEWPKSEKRKVQRSSDGTVGKSLNCPNFSSF